jgi:ferredoxin
MIWSIAAIISLVAAVGVLILLLNWKTSMGDSVNLLIGGGAIWAGILLAFQEIRSRLRQAPVPGFLRKPNDWPISVLTMLIVAMGFYALWEVAMLDPQSKEFYYPFRQLGIIGALVAAAGSALLWAREATKPVYEVTIANDNNKLYLPAGSKLMQSLKANGYVLFAQCGGKGTCATCRCKIPAGLPQEKRAPTMFGPLNEKLRGEGWILSCQIVVNSDITVDLFKPLVQKWPTPPVTTTAPGAGPGAPPAAPSKPATPAA